MQSRRLALVYLVLGLAGLALTWSQNLAYFGPAAAGGFADFLPRWVGHPRPRPHPLHLPTVGLGGSPWRGQRSRGRGVAGQ